MVAITLHSSATLSLSSETICAVDVVAVVIIMDADELGSFDVEVVEVVFIAVAVAMAFALVVEISCKVDGTSKTKNMLFSF